MFATEIGRSKLSRRIAFAGSLALHGILVFIWLRPEVAAFIHQSPAAAGAGGRSAPMVYLSAPPAAELVAPRKTVYLGARQPKLKLPREAQSRHRARNVLTEPEPAIAKANAPAGVETGSAAEGGWHDIRPALPLVFPDPEIARSEVPAGVQGDVIVEVTIDAQGYVVAQRLLTGIGPSIEQKIMAVLGVWRFRPATRDGVAIASKQDVHFHLPG